MRHVIFYISCTLSISISKSEVRRTCLIHYIHKTRLCAGFIRCRRFDLDFALPLPFFRLSSTLNTTMVKPANGFRANGVNTLRDGTTSDHMGRESVRWHRDAKAVESVERKDLRHLLCVLLEKKSRTHQSFEFWKRRWSAGSGIIMNIRQ